MSPHRFDGMHWDTEELRREREDGWFVENEAKLLVRHDAHRRGFFRKLLGFGEG
jgi:hypothetical protein